MLIGVLIVTVCLIGAAGLLLLLSADRNPTACQLVGGEYQRCTGGRDEQGNEIFCEAARNANTCRNTLIERVMNKEHN